ncbi:hypothetical protein AVEN_184157-1 [Araneus ventricosus]|uniref:Uncharacterized protein n=1 Tax=Araneus ventricosus TaxID=182803 RepID=A0A4Y2MP91_ARAVE|nr:hypothetical protein AVEN_184157-1 [Araneus ventricosus]
MNTDEEPIAKRRRRTKERKARYLARQSQESLDRIRAVDAAAYGRRIEAETPSQAYSKIERAYRVVGVFQHRGTRTLAKTSLPISLETSVVMLFL